jgi:hypothetical protein
LKLDLSAIENKLLECAKEGTPIFLYGKNSIDRKAMIRNISKEIFKKRKFISRKKMEGEDVYKEFTKTF